MKICFWMTSLFSLGGTKRVVTLLANELSKTHDVTIMCFENRMNENRDMYGLDERVKMDYLNIYEYVDDHQRDTASVRRAIVRKINKHTGFFNKAGWRCEKLGEAIFPAEAREGLSEYLNSQGYDVIIATARMALWLAMMAPKLQSKTVGWQHNCYDGYLHVKPVVFWKQEALLQKYLPQLSAYVVLSAYDQRDYLEKLGIQTVVKTNPRSFVSEKRSTSDNKHFFMCTRFVYAKGLDLILDAFEEFRKKDDEWDLNIVGDGKLLKKIKRDTEKRGLADRIHILGYSNNVQQYYMDSSIFLLPSRWEGWPMVIMEAYEYGLPVIAFHTGAMDLIIRDGETGLLPDAFDTKQFAEAMLKLAHNDSLRKEMAQNAIKTNKQYDIQVICKDWEKMLESL